MLSILIIDDTPEKVNAMRAFITTNFEEIKDSYIEDASCTNEGINLLAKNQYDLVLLDLNIPRNKNGKSSPKNAIEFLENIAEYEHINYPAHILGITRLETIDEEDKKQFDEHLWSLMRYGEDYSGWEDKLARKIGYLISSKRQLQNNPKYDYDVAIVNALQTPEQKWVKKVFGEEGWNQIKLPSDMCNNYYTKTIVDKDGRKIRVVLAYQHQMASTSSATLTTKVIYNFKPRYVFMTGIAAAIDPTDVNLGDILVASEVWDGASGKHKDVKVDANKNEEGQGETESCFLPDPRHIAIDSVMLAIVNRLKSETNLLEAITSEYRKYDEKGRVPVNVHIGPMASVPAVIASKEPLEVLQQQSRKLLGIEMETYGVFYAVANSISPRPQFVASFKSASDYATSAKDDNYQDYASFTSAAFLRHIILNELEY